MRIVKLGERVITKEEVERRLCVRIEEWIYPDDDNFLKIYTKSGYVIYLRCEDMKKLFDIDINVFDENVKITKDKIILQSKEEIYRGRFKPLDKIIK